ncbi:MAG: hypothetical protein ACPLZD_10580, partial [Candidatus Saccharicenans sp.]
MKNFVRNLQNSDPILREKLIEKIKVINNILVESFVIHMRNIINFLYQHGKRDDVTARDFVIDPNKWEEQRGKLKDFKLLKL